MEVTVVGKQDMELMPLPAASTPLEDEWTLGEAVEDDLALIPEGRIYFRKAVFATERLVALPGRRMALGATYRHAIIEEAGRRARYLSDVANVVRNQRYSMWTFVPAILHEQFRLFFNFFFLVLSLSQLIPIFQVGPWYTYFGPLIFVLCITMVKESVDDYKRHLRDKEVNGEKYERIPACKSDAIDFLDLSEPEMIPSQHIRVGDLIQLHSNQRVPADMLFLRTSDPSNQTYVRTDQLDGETDWKLRKPAVPTQDLAVEELASCDAVVRMEAPKKDIYDFTGRISLKGENGDVADGLSLENTLWANCVVTKGPVIGIVLYTGRETRAALNTSEAQSKLGLLDNEVDWNAKLCFSFLLL